METEAKLVEFFSQFKLLTYQKGELIMRPEDEPQGVFFLKTGFVRLYALTAAGQEITFNIFKPGSYFSLMWAVGSEENRYFFEAMTKIEVRRASKEAFLSFIKKEPVSLWALTERTFRGLAGLLLVMEHLLFGPAKTKVAMIILMAAKRFGEKQSHDEILIHLPLTHQLIASLAGLTRETTSLQMKNLEKQGKIGKRGRFLIVKKSKELEKELEIAQLRESPGLNLT